MREFDTLPSAVRRRGRVFLFVDTCHLIRFMIQLKSIPQFIAFVSQDKVYTRDLFRRD